MRVAGGPVRWGTLPAPVWLDGGGCAEFFLGEIWFSDVLYPINWWHWWLTVFCSGSFLGRLWSDADRDFWACELKLSMLGGRWEDVEVVCGNDMI